MPPQQTASHDPQRYDFFMTPASAPKRKFSMSGGSSLGHRLLVATGFLIVLIIIIVLVSSLFGGSNNTASFITVAQDQNELVRVATEASGQAAEQTTQNLAQSVKLSLTSEQQQLLTYLKNNGHKVSASQLTATKDVKTDQELTTAEAATNFDPVFAEVMQTGLQSYAQDLNTAYKSAGPNGKKLLQTDYNGAKLLLTQAQTLSSSLQSQ